MTAEASEIDTFLQTTEPVELPQALKDSIRPTQGDPAACVFTTEELPDAI